VANGQHSVLVVCFTQLHFVSDIAIFVLKRDVKLQLTNYATPLSTRMDTGVHKLGAGAWTTHAMLSLRVRTLCWGTYEL